MKVNALHDLLKEKLIQSNENQSNLYYYTIILFLNLGHTTKNIFVKFMLKIIFIDFSKINANYVKTIDYNNVTYQWPYSYQSMPNRLYVNTSFVFYRYHFYVILNNEH